jgi:hypothetical protein
MYNYFLISYILDHSAASSMDTYVNVLVGEKLTQVQNKFYKDVHLMETSWARQKDLLLNQIESLSLENNIFQLELKKKDNINLKYEKSEEENNKLLDMVLLISQRVADLENKNILLAKQNLQSSIINRVDIIENKIKKIDQYSKNIELNSSINSISADFNFSLDESNFSSMYYIIIFIINYFIY